MVRPSRKLPVASRLLSLPPCSSRPSPAAFVPQVLTQWRAKLERVEAGEQQWGLFRAFKPADGRDFHGAEGPDGVAGLV